MSVLEIHGTADRIVPFDGGRLPEFTRARRPVPGAREVARRWADLNHCSDRRVERDDPVTTIDWRDCDEGTSVRLVAVEGGGHAWYAPAFGPVDGAVDATAVIVEFLGLAAGP